MQLSFDVPCTNLSFMSNVEAVGAILAQQPFSSARSMPEPANRALNRPLLFQLRALVVAPDQVDLYFRRVFR
jgi:hypothetical protein